MQNIPEVERAKQLMTEAANWSVMRWLREKKNVRKSADVANAALDRLNQEVKDSWDDEARLAYNAVTKLPPVQNQKKATGADGSAVTALAKAVSQADEAAQQARADAEKTFDEAERLLSTSMAREGCKKAILSWELHEKAIAKAQALLSKTKR